MNIWAVKEWKVKGQKVKYWGAKAYTSLGIALSVAVGVLGGAATANAYQVYDAGAFLHSSSLGGQSVGYLDGVFNEFPDQGIDASFSNNLDSNGLGTMVWSLTNNTGTTLNDVQLFGYVDGEIEPDINGSYNEYGQLIAVDGQGSSDILADSWEIDEPGFSFGDIYDHLFSGSLDNTSGVTAAATDDVAAALGFSLGDLFTGDSVLLTLTISLENIGGLMHADADNGQTFYINGTAVVDRAVSVPEPWSMALMATGLFGVVWLRRKAG